MEVLLWIIRLESKLSKMAIADESFPETHKSLGIKTDFFFFIKTTQNKDKAEQQDVLTANMKAPILFGWYLWNMLVS